MSSIPTDVDHASIAGRMHLEGFEHVSGTGWYRHAEYERFSDEEYARRFRLTREKMARLGIDVLLAAGGPNHWSFAGGMGWLSGYWEWHGMSAFVVVPADGDPVLVAGPGGAHREAIRQLTPIEEVRHSRGGRSDQVILDVLRERGLEGARVGLTYVDPVYKQYPPYDVVTGLQEGLGDGLAFVGDFFHEFFYAKSPEEVACLKVAGKLLDQALYAMVSAIRPGVTEVELAAAAAQPILEGGGRINFTIVGSTPMDDPAMAFGNPWPSSRVVREGDIVLNELACGYRGYTVQLGSPICVGTPPSWISELFTDVVRPGFDAMAAQLAARQHLGAGPRGRDDLRRIGDGRPAPVAAHHGPGDPPPVRALEPGPGRRGRPGAATGGGGDAGAHDHHARRAPGVVLRPVVRDHRGRQGPGHPLPPRADRRLIVRHRRAPVLTSDGSSGIVRCNRLP